MNAAIITLDWSAHIPDTLADLQSAVADGDSKTLVADITAEARSIGATEAQITSALASGREMARHR